MEIINRKAKFNYEILKEYECGIALALAFVALFAIYALARGIIHV